ncbi:MAG: tRNA-(ms[2]io[6]A)-hydroxylase [Saprospiraceae bacterium]|nr:tRNA-(ms[2]io[6]A)-hydroxylase [Saprospiraceae bacterium]
MKLNLDIKVPSSDAWLKAVMDNFNAFLQDHADCERKASAMAMSFVAKYPDRTEIVPELIETAIEELEHFQSVYEIMQSRGLSLQHSIGEDPYAKALVSQCHSGIRERFLDRLLIASVMETRGAERFKMVSDAQEDEDLFRFYKELWTSEAKHGHIFVKMALLYFEKDQVYDRLNWWLDRESEIIENLEVRAALH